jgi:hypothetical protein
MSDLFDSILGRVLNAVHWLFGKNYTPSQQTVFKSDAYDPIRGAVIRGFVDNPGISLTTYFPPPPKGLELLQGNLKTHFVSSDVYKMAYKQRKMKEFNKPKIFTMQLEQQRGPPRQERKMTFVDGSYISSRDKNSTLNHIRTTSSMWETANKFKF